MSLENPMPGGQTPPTGAPQPAYPPYPAYPTYPSYPGYPTYAPHPYYGYAAMAHAGPPVLPPVPSRAPDKPARLRLTRLLLLVILAGVTALALILAAVAPALVARDPGPPTGGGYTQVYNASLRDVSESWDLTTGCTFEGGGLYAASGSTPTLCLFTPSRGADYTGGGFYLTTQLVPPGALAAQEGGCIQLSSSGTAVTFAIEQSGAFALNTDPGYQCSTSSAPPRFLQDTPVWHGNGSLPNTVSLSYDSGGQVLTVYLNGQQILQRNVDLSGLNNISLGTPPTGNGTGNGLTYEAVFTSFGLWSHA